MLRLRTIGEVSVEVGSTVIDSSSPHALAALFYLSVERGKQVARKTLAELLFPAADEHSAMHSLRQLIYRLRKLGAPIEGSTSATASVCREAASWDFELLIATGQISEDQLSLITKGFLCDDALRISAKFERW